MNRFGVRFIAATAIGCLALLTGCETTEPVAEGEKKPLSLRRLGDVFGDVEQTRDPDATKPIVASELRAERMSDKTLPSRRANVDAIGGPPKQYSLAAARTKADENPDEMYDVDLAGDALDIVTVVEAFSKILEFDYFLDPAVSGTVSITLETEMTRAEAWELFEYLLWTSGAYASEKNGFLEIVPFAKMPKDRRLFATHEPIPNVTVEMIRLYHLTPSEVIGQLQPFMTEGASATAIAHLNSILLVEAPPNMDKLRSLIKQLDILGETRWPVMSLRTNTEVQTIVDEVSRLLPVMGYTISGESSDGKSTKVIGLERHNILVASAPVQEVLDEVARWVDALDVEEASDEESIYFYPVQYNTAEDLVDGVSVFFPNAETTFSTTSDSGSSSSGRSSTSSRLGTNNTSRTQNSNSRSQTRTVPTRTNSNSRSGNRDDDVQPQTVFEIPVTIHADGPRNQIIVRTLPRAYAMLEALLRRMDTPPLQVLIQTTIAEINLDDDWRYGLRYELFGELSKNTTVDTGLGSVGGLTDTVGATSSGPFSVVLQNSPRDLLAQIEATAGKRNTRVVSEPQVLAISDQEAVINVGDSVPTLSEFSGNLDGDSINTTRNSVQYVDTGIILTVTPHITAKKLVTLDIRQEVSSATETSAGVTGSPTIQTRELETSMVIEDGSTVVLGGLITSDVQRGRDGIPGVMELPFFGTLFRSQFKDARRTELLFMISVKVIDVKTDFQKFLERYRESVESIDQIERIGD